MIIETDFFDLAPPPANAIAQRTVPKGDVAAANAAAIELAGIGRGILIERRAERLQMRLTVVDDANSSTYYLTFDEPPQHKATA